MDLRSTQPSMTLKLNSSSLNVFLLVAFASSNGLLFISETKHCTWNACRYCWSTFFCCLQAHRILNCQFTRCRDLFVCFFSLARSKNDNVTRFVYMISKTSRKEYNYFLIKFLILFVIYFCHSLALLIAVALPKINVIKRWWWYFVLWNKYACEMFRLFQIHSVCIFV